jgi:BirA family transcriptional regulator, biotin operon repressor / biotin---[acetyl-CoA-carboxylase] ligase
LKLEAAAVSRLLHASLQHIDITCVAETGSTNSDLLQVVRSIPPKLGQPILRQAAWQRAGRGQRGRPWLGKAGQVLSFSLAWPLASPLEKINGISLVCGLALADAITADLPATQAQRLSLKWPNDILLDGKKLAGILIETANEQAGHCWAVIGVGINYRYDAELEQQLGHPLAAFDALRTDFDLTSLLAACCNALAQRLCVFAARGWTAWRSAWEHYDAYHGQLVELRQDRKIIAYGRAQGVDDIGRLLVATQTGLRSFTAGEVSLRPEGNTDAKLPALSRHRQ